MEIQPRHLVLGGAAGTVGGAAAGIGIDRAFDGDQSSAIFLGAIFGPSAGLVGMMVLQQYMNSRPKELAATFEKLAQLERRLQEEFPPALADQQEKLQEIAARTREKLTNRPMRSLMAPKNVIYLDLMVTAADGHRRLDTLDARLPRVVPEDLIPLRDEVVGGIAVNRSLTGGASRGPDLGAIGQLETKTDLLEMMVGTASKLR